MTNEPTNDTGGYRSGPSTGRLPKLPAGPAPGEPKKLSEQSAEMLKRLGPPKEPVPLTGAELSLLSIEAMARQAHGDAAVERGQPEQERDEAIDQLAIRLHSESCGWNCYGHGIMQERQDAKYERMARVAVEYIWPLAKAAGVQAGREAERRDAVAKICEVRDIWYGKPGCSEWGDALDALIDELGTPTTAGDTPE